MMFEVALPGARALFTTRQGGSSESPYDSRNLGLRTDDDEVVVRGNIRQLQNELGLPTLQLLDQVHGSQIVNVTSATAGTVPIADGAITTERRHAMLITGADCPAVMLASESRLAALHCGWRPVAANLIEKGAAAFAGERFEAVIGPGICQEHFEVGPEVIQAMGEHGPAHAEGRQLDLVGIIETRLRIAGAERVHVVERCTHCEPEFFFSHRRDNGATGRQAGIAWRI
ncbi:MAG: laccase domain-containing protein [Thermoleophilaceae bacterium]|nr:laccase domain-containing protein [Thermoleophilaceae bacterium]